nr:alpha/beta hydrolase domain-containing protein [Micromonospora sp. DSM 115978]
ALPTPLGPGAFDLTMPNPTLIRTDLSVPTFVVLTETDVPLHLTARQPDSATVHTWEVAGTSHADQWLLDTMKPVMSRMFNAPIPPPDCGPNAAPINNGSARYAKIAALTAMSRWVRGGPAPATGEPIVLPC